MQAQDESLFLWAAIATDLASCRVCCTLVLQNLNYACMFSYLCLLLNELAYFKVRCMINHTNLHPNLSIPKSILIMVITMFTKYTKHCQLCWKFLKHYHPVTHDHLLENLPSKKKACFNSHCKHTGMFVSLLNWDSNARDHDFCAACVKADFLLLSIYPLNTNWKWEIWTVSETWGAAIQTPLVHVKLSRDDRFTRAIPRTGNRGWCPLYP